MVNHPMTEGIQVLKDNAVVRIHFAHDKQNAFPANHLKALQLALEKVSNDSDIHVIVLQSDPSKAFCAGASFDELLAVKTPEEGKASENVRIFDVKINVIGKEAYSDQLS